MKRIALLLWVCLAAPTLWAQGLVNFLNSSITLISTSDGMGTTPIGNTAGTYFFGLFVAPAGTVDPNQFTFTGLYGTNQASAGRMSGGAGRVVPGWLPGQSMSFLVRGWSAALGHDWSVIEQQYFTGMWLNPGYFGQSGIGTGIAGGFDGTGTLPNLGIFGGTSGLSGFVLYPTTLTPPREPRILMQPLSQTILQWRSVKFSVSAGGESPLSYQWRFNGTNLPGATTYEYTIANVQPEHAGPYSVVINNFYGTATSTDAILTVTPSVQPPYIITPPVSRSGAIGDTVVFSVEAGGAPPLSYQWQFTGTNLPGATDPSLTLTNIQLSQAGSYSVVVSNAGGTASAAAWLSIPKPIDRGLVIFFNSTATVISTNAASVGGSSGLTATNIPGFYYGLFVAPLGTTNPLLFEFSGCYATNLATPGRLSGGTSVEVPQWTAGTTNSFLVRGWSAHLGHDWNSIATQWNPGSTPQWSAEGFFGSSIIASGIAGGFDGEATFPNLVLFSLLTISNGFSLNYVAPATPPHVLQGPVGVAGLLGGSASFSVVADGSPPRTYQWKFNGNPIAGATGSALTIPVVQITDAGSYSVLVSNPLGSTESPPAQLVVEASVAHVTGISAGASNSFLRSATVALECLFPGGVMFYTLDGSAPTAGSRLYSQPFTITRDTVLRVLAYRSDFQQTSQSIPVIIQIIPAYVVETRVPGGGAVQVNPPDALHGAGSSVTITAVPSPGWVFLHWLGDAEGTNPVQNLTMNGDKTVQAVFGTPLDAAVTGLGNVSAQPALAAYPYGSVVRLSAVPQAGNYFVLWGQPAAGHQNPVNVVVTNPNPEVSALFTAQGPQQASLTVSWQGAGQVEVSPKANVYARGANVKLTAEAEPGQVFLGWEGDLAGAVNPAVVTLNQDTVIQARFSARPMLSAPAGLAGMKPEGFRLMLTAGQLNQVYRIEGSADLQVWQLSGWVTNTFGTAQFLDPAPGTHRAYRVAY